MNKVIATFSLLIAFVGFSLKTQAQQIINAYARVIAEDVSCNNRIVVDSCGGFKEGDTILIIQMKTYSVDSTNTPTFGDTLAYNGAGNYEYNVIKKIFPGCEFELKYEIERTYQWTLGKVQIVKVPYFQDYTVSGQFLTCKPWDDATGKGGILAFRVANTLTLDTNIDVSGRGFRGGRVQYLGTSFCNMTDYYYPPGTNEGAEKGEGVGFLSPSKMYGRGKMTNGGGGGNAGKSGGAGGGGGGRGGNGGDQWQANPTCANIIPNIGGIGGMPLRYNNFFRTIFLGGGGGAGHGDTLGEIPGGNGGAIVIIDAPTIIGNNRLIISNGQDAPECSGTGQNCQSDGGGGGGGGGTILIKSGTISNLLQVRAKGGKGADIYSGITVNATYQPGPGGGGGGGVAWFSTAAVPAGVSIDITGGARGILPQFNNNANGSQVGQNGLTLTNLILPSPKDTFDIKYNLDFRDSVITCASRKFINTTSPTGLVFSWYWNFGDGFSDTAKSPTHNYAAGGIYTVQLAAQDITGCTDTLTRVIVVANLSYDISDTVLGCRTHQFLATKTIDSSIFPDAAKFHWAFGDGDTAVGNPIVHTYDTGGLYTVVLTVTDSSGCTDTTHFTADVADAMADFTVSDDTVCQGEQVNFTDASAPNSIFHAWDLGEGTIDSAQNPNVIYPFEGIYTVRLIVGNITGCIDTAFKYVVVDSISPVNYIPSDTVLCEGQTIVLDGYYIKDNALGADWDLGDGFTAVNTDPVIHAYDTSGLYNVTLTVRFRACPTVVFSKLVNINPFPALNLGPDTTMCPNGPAIVLTDNVNISNPIARWKWNTGDTTHTIAVRHPGIYSARVNVNGCVTNDSVEVFKDCYIDIPNAFTPNNDGSNDYFLPRQLLAKSVARFSMVIYNRWGQEIFQTSSVDGRGWDGMFNGKEQPMGVYVYRINVTFASGASESYTGNLTLIR